MKTAIKGVGLGVTLRSNTFLSTLMAAGVVVASVAPAFADISNTATVRGEGPGGNLGDPTDDITASDNADVPIQPVDPPSLAATKTITSSPANGTGYVLGETITYTIRIENTGDSYVRNVSVADTPEGSVPSTPVFAAVPLEDNNTVTDSTDADNSDNEWDLLAPDDAIIYTSSHVVTADDLANNGYDGDGEFDNSVVASGDTNIGGTPGTVDSPPATAAAPLEIDASLSIAKSAVPASGVVAGDTITYTYVVTNDGNVPITNISISDAHEPGGQGAATFLSTAGPFGTGTGEWEVAETGAATSGTANADTAGDGVFDTLGVGGEVTFTYRHVVTQLEIDDQ